MQLGSKTKLVELPMWSMFDELKKKPFWWFFYKQPHFIKSVLAEILLVQCVLFQDEATVVIVGGKKVDWAGVVALNGGDDIRPSSTPFGI